MAQVQEANLKFLQDGMKPLFTSFEQEVESLATSGADKQRHNLINARLHKVTDLFSRLVVDLISGMNQINEEKLNNQIAENTKLQDNYNKLKDNLIQN